LFLVLIGGILSTNNAARDFSVYGLDPIIIAWRFHNTNIASDSNIWPGGPIFPFGQRRAMSHHIQEHDQFSDRKDAKEKESSRIEYDSSRRQWKEA
jgi:hypothetical protein